MSTETKPRRSDPWVNPPSPGEKPEPGYEEHVRKSIEDGRAQIKAGKGIPAEKVWKELGIELRSFFLRAPETNCARFKKNVAAVMDAKRHISRRARSARAVVKVWIRPFPRPRAQALRESLA